MEFRSGTRPEGFEVRSFSGPLETRAAPDGSESPGTLVGYACKYDSRAKRGWMGFEEFAPGLFDESLTQDDQRALFNHNVDLVLARRSVDTLALESDSEGLKATITLPDTTVARDLYALVKRGDIDGMSVGMIVTKEEWTYDREDESKDVRRIVAARLGEVTVATFPVYQDTTLTARSQKLREEGRAAFRATRLDGAAPETPPEPAESAPEPESTVDPDSVRIESQRLQLRAMRMSNRILEGQLAAAERHANGG